MWLPVLRPYGGRADEPRTVRPDRLISPSHWPSLGQILKAGPRDLQITWMLIGKTSSGQTKAMWVVQRAVPSQGWPCPGAGHPQGHQANPCSDQASTACQFSQGTPQITFLPPVASESPTTPPVDVQHFPLLPQYHHYPHPHLHTFILHSHPHKLLKNNFRAPSIALPALLVSGRPTLNSKDLNRSEGVGGGALVPSEEETAEGISVGCDGCQTWWLLP